MKSLASYLKSHEVQLLVVWGLCFGLGSGLGYAGGTLFSAPKIVPFGLYGFLIGFSLGGLIAGWFLLKVLQRRLSLNSVSNWKPFAFYWGGAILFADLGIWLFYRYLEFLGSR